MAGVKRRVDAAEDRNGKRSKTKTVSASKSKTAAPVKKSSSKKEVKPKKDDLKKSSKKKVQEESEDEDEDEDEDDFDIDDISDDDIDAIDESPEDDVDMEDVDEKEEEETPKQENKHQKITDEAKSNASRESHAKQKALQQERKAAKPNADQIARSKKLWEQLRRKSHVKLEDRKKLIKELFEIITGRVRDFVFKHDSVRVIQTALKYGNLEQRKQIAQELKGSYKELAQSRYAKFLVGKLIVHGDNETRDMIIPEFYANVRRLIRHPEGSWILDDIYRTVATKAQKTRLLREWYGAEFVIFQEEKEPTSDLPKILEAHPEKRGPIMQYLFELINQLVQKKSTGFTMLHDAMLQYFLATKPGSTEANEFIELLKGDEEGDLVKNLAFTQSGSRLVSLTLAYANAKDRKLLLRFYRDTVKAMAGDLNGHMVLLAAYEVIDDTKLSAKSIFGELLNQNDPEEARNEELCYQVNDLTARVAILYPFAGERVKWLLPEQDQEILKEVREIRKGTSKKEPATRRLELVKAASPTLLALIAARAETLLETTMGCQFINEVLFEADGDKTAALEGVAQAAKTKSETRDSASVGRLLKSLVQGGRFNPATKSVEKVEPALNFHDLLYEQISDEVMDWATGANPFVIVALTESDDFSKKDELLKTLKKNKKALEKASVPGSDEKKPGPTSSGAKILLQKL
jgi:pumilio family protein 6